MGAKQISSGNSLLHPIGSFTMEMSVEWEFLRTKVSLIKYYYSSKAMRTLFI